LRQSEQGLGVPEHLDTATKTSPKWLNMSPKAIRQLPQRQITAKASLCCSLRPAQNPITQSLPNLKAEMIKNEMESKRNFHDIELGNIKKHLILEL
jgi:hypothetical protein